jgi:nucleoside 2-deoxyribosyltransferase
MRPRAYLAAPLFSEAERSFNRTLKEILSPHFDVFLPQESGYLLTELVSAGDSVEGATHQVFHIDMEAIHQCDFFVAVFDGRAIDEGVAFELGVAYTLKKHCIALQTDSRRLLPLGNNPMLTGAIESLFVSTIELACWAASLSNTMRDSSEPGHRSTR